MAYFAPSSAAFDMRHLDLNAVFQGTSTALTEATTGELAPGIGYPTVLIPVQLVSHDTQIQIDVAAAQVYDLYGTGLVADAAGTLTAGTLSRLNGAVSLGGPAINVVGFSLSAADFSAAAATVSSADDYQLFRRIFAGNDYVFGSSANDSMGLGRGSDVYNDQGGQDRVFGAAAADYLSIGSNDSLADQAFGGAGNDLLFNATGAGFMSGGAGNDTLISGVGNDRSFGGPGTDVFVYRNDNGHHTITDFDPGQDQIVLMDAVAFGDLTITAFHGGTRLSYGSWSVQLQGVNPGLLTAGHFQSGADAYIAAAETAFLTGWEYDV